MSGEVFNVYHDKLEDQHISAMKRAFVSVISGHVKVTCKLIVI